MFFRIQLITGSMHQIADVQLIESLDLLTVIQSLWNGMVLLLGSTIGRSF